jgi:hypothetical protein
MPKVYDDDLPTFNVILLKVVYMLRKYLYICNIIGLLKLIKYAFYYIYIYIYIKF